MFLGTYFPRLDEKARLILPAKHRPELAGGLVLAKGQERCIVVYPAADFARAAEHLRTTSSTDGRVRDYVRVLASSAVDDTPDTQGRITIPASLREWANLTREVAVVGNFTRLEIWDAPTWQVWEAQKSKEFAELRREMVPGL